MSARTLEDELALRSAESGLPRDTLRAVYLREDTTTARALARVDAFVLYALTRDSAHARDRDLVP